MRNVFYIVVGIIIIAGLGYFWWSSQKPIESTTDTYGYGTEEIPGETPGTTPTPTGTTTGTNMQNPKVTFKTSMGDITLELYMDKMPVTAGNFLKLAKEGYYTNQKFHRVIPNFMIQGGDPLTKDDTQMNRWGTGGPGYTIKDEFVAGLSNVRGTISMANTGAPNSGGSQFFINTVDNLGLDFDKPPTSSSHPVFGKVVAGMEVVDAISKVARNAADRPNTPVVITAVTVQE